MSRGGPGRPSAAVPTRAARGRAGAAPALACGLLAALAVALFALLARYYRPHRTDDAYIFFRYAANLLACHGPVWNPGQAPVEGYSSPLWLGLLALGGGAHRLLAGGPGGAAAGVPAGAAGGAAAAAGGALIGPADDVVAWASALGQAAAAAAVVLVWLLARRLGAGRVLACVAAAAAAGCLPLHFWAPTGMETTLVAALLLWAAWGLAAPRGRAWVAPVALLGVARPEGPALVALALLLVWRSGGLTWRRAAVAALPALAWEVFRLAYYGAALPNAYYAKATGALGPQIVEGLRYVAPVLPAWALALLARALAARATRAAPAARDAGAGGGAAWSGHALIAGLLAVAVYAGGDWMEGQRFLVPVCLLLLADVAATAHGAWDGLRARRAAGAAAGASAAGPSPASAAGPPPGPPRRAPLGPPLALTLALLAAAALVPGFAARPGHLAAACRGETVPPTGCLEGTLVAKSLEAAAWIGAHYPPGLLVAINHAGALPYGLPAFRFLDLMGLNDAHIARQVVGRRHRKSDPEYVLGRRPDLIVLNARTKPGTGGQWLSGQYGPVETALRERPDFARSYRPVPIYWECVASWGAPAYILLYERVPEGEAEPGDIAAPGGGAALRGETGPEGEAASPPAPGSRPARPSPQGERP